MNTAAKVRKEKERQPERFCPKCLWRVEHRDGRVTPCPKHQVVAAVEASLEGAGSQ